jgi:hypothetical protein
LGGAGWQDGQIETGDVLGALPLANWVGKMISHLSYMFLGMPRELEFKFMEGGREDTESTARTTEINIKSGTLTLNEARSRAGLTLIEAPEADMPILVAGTGAYLVTDTGLKPIDENVLVTDDGQAVTQEEIEPVVTEEEKAIQDELRQFIRWLKKSPTRDFRFKNVPVVYAEVLNKFIGVKDYDSARWYAERYLA